MVTPSPDFPRACHASITSPSRVLWRAQVPQGRGGNARAQALHHTNWYRSEHRHRTPHPRLRRRRRARRRNKHKLVCLCWRLGSGKLRRDKPDNQLVKWTDCSISRALGGSPLASAKFRMVLDNQTISGTALVLDPGRQAAPFIRSTDHFSTVDLNAIPLTPVKNQINWSISSVLPEHLNQFGPVLPDYDDTTMGQFCDWVSFISLTRESYVVVVRYINGAKFAQSGAKLAKAVITSLFPLPR